MKLSVIIPIYNVEPWLPRCVESVLSQDFKDYEIILIDDGSTDGSGAICDAFASEHACVQALHKPNGGLSSARNAGLDRASGEYILFLDSDDWIAPGCLARFAPLFEQAYDVIQGCAREISEQGVEISCQRCRIPVGAYSARDYLSDALANERIIAFCSQYYLCRRQFVEEHALRFYEGILHEDELWTPLVLLAADTIYMTDEYFYYHYQRAGSITHSQNRLQRAYSTITICRELDRVFAAHPEKPCKWLRNSLAMLFLRDIPYVPDSGTITAEFGRLFPLKNAASPRQRSKALLFAAFPTLYCRLIRRKNRGKYGAL